MFYTKKKQNFITPYVVMFFLALSGLILILGIGQYANHKSSLDPDGEKATIQKYAIQCYASEGAYPPDLDYLSQHYGLILEPQKYTYYYNAFGSNIMPEIIVTKAVELKEELLKPGENYD